MMLELNDHMDINDDGQMVESVKEIFTYSTNIFIIVIILHIFFQILNFLFFVSDESYKQ